MLEKRECILKETFDCYYVTKDNWKEFVKVKYPKYEMKNVLTLTDYGVQLEVGYIRPTIYFDSWYVKNVFGEWEQCYEGMFNELYKLIDKE